MFVRVLWSRGSRHIIECSILILFFFIGVFFLFLNARKVLCEPYFPLTVTGTLKGYDQLLNLVLDEAIEFLRGNELTGY